MAPLFEKRLVCSQGIAVTSCETAIYKIVGCYIIGWALKFSIPLYYNIGKGCFKAARDVVKLSPTNYNE